MNKQQNTPKSIYSQHKKSVEYKSGLGIGLFEQAKKNERFFIGDQWLGQTTSSNMPLTSNNYIKRIVNYECSQITSNPLTANFSAEGLPSFLSEETKKVNKQVIEKMQGGETELFDKLDNSKKINLVIQQLGKYYKSVEERLKLNLLFAQAVKNSAISGTGAIYAYWDSAVATGQFADSTNETAIRGDVSAEIIYPEEQLDVCNPAESDINKQDYIIISKKVTVEQAKRMAKINGIKAEEIEKIKPETSSETLTYERDENAQESVERVTIYTKMFKKFSEDGKDYSIYAVMCTSDVEIKPEWDTLLKRYPIVLFQWEERRKCIFGESEITYLIQNQIAVNKMKMSAVWSAILTGVPMLLIDRNKIQGEITNEPGQILEFYGEGDIGKAATYLQPPSFSNSLINTSENIISHTLSASGANDAALGELRSDNASAIVAQREAATAPLQPKKNRYYQFVEDFVRVLAEFWVQYYGTRKLKISDKRGNWFIPFESDKFKDLVLSVRIDVGASGIWSKVQSLQVLDSYLEGGYINALQHLERLPDELITDKQGLIDELREVLNAQKAKAEQVSAEEDDIENFNVDDFYEQLPIEEQEAYDRKTHKEQQAMIETAKQALREEQASKNEN